VNPRHGSIHQGFGQLAALHSAEDTGVGQLLTLPLVADEQQINARA